MKENKIGIVVLATNAYFVLGVRFIQNFKKFYKGEPSIHFYLYTDRDPSEYFHSVWDQVSWIKTEHESWIEATNSKFQCILDQVKLFEMNNIEYLYYFDADTNINSEFNEDWFLGDLVGGEHWANKHHMKDVKEFDRNPKSAAYVPEDTKLIQTYYYGAFFGGKTENVINFCKTLRHNQLQDKNIPYEPRWNDESYINHYFHFNPPTKIVLSQDFQFLVSDKAGIEHTRDPKTNIEEYIERLLNKAK